MSDDRELLELAARAAGVDGYFDSDDQNERDTYWNPLTDDGDALRLAVKLNLAITFDCLDNGAMVKVNIPYDHPDFDNDYFWNEWLDKDPLAATRRAVVRAAADIGRPITD